LAAAVVLLGGSRAAHAGYCLNGPIYDGSFVDYVRYSIPVYLVDQDRRFLDFSIETAEQQLTQAIDNWAENSGGDFHPYYAGISLTMPWIDGNAVYVVDDTDTSICGGAGSCEEDDYYDIWTNRTGGKIWLLNPPQTGYSWVIHGAYYNLQGAFTHELGHAWGLADDWGGLCEGTPWSSAMAVNCGVDNGAKYITRRDAAGIRKLYGPRSDKSGYQTIVSTTYGNTWGAPSTPPGDGPALLRLGTEGTPGALELFARASFGDGSGTLLFDGMPGSPFTLMDPEPSVPSFDVASAAARDALHFAFIERTGETELDCRKRVRVVATQNGGATWIGADLPGTSLGSPALSEPEGASIAFDPQSQTYVGAWLTHDERVAFNVIPTDLGTTYAAEVYPNSAAQDYPAIACGSPNLVGRDNCMVVWPGVDTVEPGANHVRWAVGHVGTRSDGSRYFVMQTPSVGDVTSLHTPGLTAQPNADRPWVMALKAGPPNEGDYIWTYRFNPPANQWTDQRTAVVDVNGVMSPTIAWVAGRLQLRYLSFKP
jgi:hypothetical protein